MPTRGAPPWIQGGGWNLHRGSKEAAGTSTVGPRRRLEPPPWDQGGGWNLRRGTREVAGTSTVGPRRRLEPPPWVQGGGWNPPWDQGGGWNLRRGTKEAAGTSVVGLGKWLESPLWEPQVKSNVTHGTGEQRGRCRQSKPRLSFLSRAAGDRDNPFGHEVRSSTSSQVMGTERCWTLRSLIFRIEMLQLVLPMFMDQRDTGKSADAVTGEMLEEHKPVSQCSEEVKIYY
ncbi:uncharacterized protein [Narcine bancroftii]|uniref:uncharacterized protein n=1 Tax=Narcine bancroftii TaxID=1343680 RepID=UPI0038311529